MKLPKINSAAGRFSESKHNIKVNAFATGFRCKFIMTFEHLGHGDAALPLTCNTVKGLLGFTTRTIKFNARLLLNRPLAPRTEVSKTKKKAQLSMCAVDMTKPEPDENTKSATRVTGSNSSGCAHCRFCLYPKLRYPHFLLLFHFGRKPKKNIYQMKEIYHNKAVSPAIQLS